MPQTISYHTALIYVMVTMSAVDRTMTDSELGRIGQIVQTLPIFSDFNPEWVLETAQDCGAILQEDGGLDAVLGLVKEALPDKLHETAYALAVDIAAADLTLEAEELRFLQMLRSTLHIDKLIAASIERAARARHQVA
ncbi:MAG: tellurite resistance TerB family protein [Pseudomonadota bacterium]